ncbi:MAG: CBS domain-containing protein [Trueperaceae bacterium]
MNLVERERNRAEDFLNAFNTIEAELKRRTGLASHDSLRQAAHRYREESRGWQRDFEAVMAFADLRNVIVHERYKRFAYLSVPSEEVLDEIHSVRDRLLEPRTAFEEFRRSEVTTVEVSTSLEELLAKVADNDFTQFPVYDHDAFVGLITSNGVTRWLAQRVQQLPLVEFDSHTVGELLEREEERPNWTFVPRALPVEEVAYAFQENPELEAALVTQSGRQDEALLGIATRSDIASLSRE